VARALEADVTFELCEGREIPGRLTPWDNKHIILLRRRHLILFVVEYFFIVEVMDAERFSGTHLAEAELQCGKVSVVISPIDLNRSAMSAIDDWTILPVRPNLPERTRRILLN
jgi:hypothetical protein